MERKVQSKSRYLMAFIIGTLIFVIGFSITYGLSRAELARINNVQQDTAYSIFSDKLKYSFFEGDICSDASYESVSEDLGLQGRIIDDMERKFGKDDDKVLFRKRFYTLVELEHFEYVLQRNERCQDHVNTILFFYSNEGGKLDASERVGKILGVITDKEVVIYSFDVNLDSDIVGSLKEKYGISDAPLVVVNEGPPINVYSINDVDKELR